MPSWICLDSSVLLKLVLPEPDSGLAEALWRRALEEDRRPAAPSLLDFEVTAVLRKHVQRGALRHDLAVEALDQAMAFGVETLTFPGMHQRALALAHRFGHASAYDAHYLALAQELECPFWTADRRLHASVAGQLPWVHLLAELAQGTAGHAD